jgi:arylamine N-acetyltransferase
MVCMDYRSHMVNIVTLGDGKRYMLDVGFGRYGPIRPLLLDAEGSMGPGIGAAATRLVKRNIPQNSDRGQELWVYEHRSDPHSEWLAMYSFSEVEFLPEDYEMMSFWTSRSRKIYFTYRVVVVRMVMEEGEVVGTLVLVGGELKRRVGGKMEVLRVCVNEEQRVEVLGEWFDIRFSDQEKAGIRGMVTELRE